MLLQNVVHRLHEGRFQPCLQYHTTAKASCLPRFIDPVHEDLPKLSFREQACREPREPVASSCPPPISRCPRRMRGAKPSPLSDRIQPSSPGRRRCAAAFRPRRDKGVPRSVSIPITGDVSRRGSLGNSP
jgi:hypothetical protein